MKLPRPFKRRHQDPDFGPDLDFVLTVPSKQRCTWLERQARKDARRSKPLDLEMSEPPTIQVLRAEADRRAATSQSSLRRRVDSSVHVVMSAANGAPLVSDGDTRASRAERDRRSTWLEMLSDAATDVRRAELDHQSLVAKIEDYGNSEIAIYVNAFRAAYHGRDPLRVDEVRTSPDLRTLGFQIDTALDLIATMDGVPARWALPRAIRTLGTQPEATETPRLRRVVRPELNVGSPSQDGAEA
jgi:hypothetical protein